VRARVRSDRSSADTPCMAKAKAKDESRFGFGQAVGALGAFIAIGSLSQPFVKMDLGAAFKAALEGSELSGKMANSVLYVGSRTPANEVDTSPQVAELARMLGVESTGFAQDQIASIVVAVLAVIALIAVVRSVFAATAWGARANAPYLAVAGFGSIIVAALELWVRSPEPRQAMRPDLGLWLLVAGGVLLLLGALTLGNNRRRPFLDDLAGGPGSASFDNTEHLAYSHGAWVPRSHADTER
jgi:hypothetical protein